MNRFAASAAFVLAFGIALPALASGTTPSKILANPSSFQGKAVTVTGKVSHFQTSKTMIGTVAAFQLCDTKCVVVIDETNGSHHDGEQATVSGTFQTKFKGPRRSFSNAVVIK